MHDYTLTHLSDFVLLRDLTALVARERVTTAAVLAHIAEVDSRRLYLPAGFPSMRAYCVGELRLSEDAAYKRIQAARAARDFPAIFDALVDGRLHLTGLGLLAPHLTTANAEGLVAAASGIPKSEIEQLLARRFPGTESLELVQAIPGSSPLGAEQLAPAQVDGDEASRGDAFAHFGELAPAQVVAPAPRSRVAPIAHERFLIQLAIGKSTHDKLRHAQALLSHSVPSGDIAVVFDRALDALVGQLEKRKFAATTKPRTRSRRSSANARRIPADVKRIVWERDQGQCTFVSEGGRRCSSRKRLEFDHIDPVARGGQATMENVRLRCTGHNQYEAERMFGTGFMSDKRGEARCAAGAARTRVAAAQAQARAAESDARAQAAEAQARSQLLAKEHSKDVMAGLRELGFRAGEARRAVEFCETLQDATLEERVRAALKFLCPKSYFRDRVGANGEARV